MIELVKGLALVIGVIVGVRVGLRGLAMLWFVVGLTYLLVRIPLSCYEMGNMGFYGNANSQGVGIIMLIMSIVVILWLSLRFGARFFRSLRLDTIPDGVDRAFGGALGGASLFILVSVLI